MVCVDVHDIPVVAVVDPDMMSTMPKVLPPQQVWTHLRTQLRAT